MRYLKVIAAALFVIIVVIFILQNNDLHRSVHLGFGWDIFKSGLSAPAPAATADAAAPAAPAARPGVDVPVFILVFLAFFAGLILASLFSLAEKYRLKRVVRAGTGRVKELEAEIKSLRNMPLTGPADAKPVIKPTTANSAAKAEPQKDKAASLPTGLSKTKGLPEPEPKPVSPLPLKPDLPPKGAPDNKNQPSKPAPSSPLPAVKKDAPSNGIASRPLEVKSGSPAKPVPAAAPSKDLVPAAGADKKEEKAPAEDKDKAPEAPAKKSGLFSRLTGNGKKKAEEKKGD